jgi:hypothetical protein
LLNVARSYLLIPNNRHISVDRMLKRMFAVRESHALVE